MFVLLKQILRRKKRKCF